MYYLSKREIKEFHRCIKELGIYSAYVISRRTCLTKGYKTKRLYCNDSHPDFRCVLDCNLAWLQTGYASLWGFLWDEWRYTEKTSSEMLKMDLEPLKRKIKERFKTI